MNILALTALFLQLGAPREHLDALVEQKQTMRLQGRSASSIVQELETAIAAVGR